MYTGKKILIGLSGGINSMAILCWLIESGQKPAEVHLFYAHFAEHSPDTFQFVADGIRYARKHFPCVKARITSNSVLKYFEKQNMIPHPVRSTCSYWGRNADAYYTEFGREDYELGQCETCAFD